MPLFSHLTHFRELGQKYKNISVRFLVQKRRHKFILRLSRDSSKNFKNSLDYLTFSSEICWNILEYWNFCRTVFLAECWKYELYANSIEPTCSKFFFVFLCSYQIEFHAYFIKADLLNRHTLMQLYDSRPHFSLPWIIY